MTQFLIAAATGNVGSAVAQTLLDEGASVRVAGTDVAELRRRFPGAEAARFEFREPDSFASALAGATRLFVLRPPAVANVRATLNRFVDAAAEAGVEHVVYSSVAGADKNRWLPHRALEDHLAASKVDWTILRPGFFAQNFGGAYRDDIAKHDRIYLPAGKGRVAFIDARDIGEAAAKILLDPENHVGRGYWLTGPEAIDFDRAAEILSQALGRPIRYEAASIAGYVRHLLVRQRLGAMQTTVQTILHVGLRKGDAEGVDPTLSELLGRPPRTFGDYVNDHLSLWKRE